MFIKLVFSKNICVAIFEYLIGKIIITLMIAYVMCAHVQGDGGEGAWGGVCVHACMCSCMCVCVHVCACVCMCACGGVVGAKNTLLPKNTF